MSKRTPPRPLPWTIPAADARRLALLHAQLEAAQARAELLATQARAEAQRADALLAETGALLARHGLAPGLRVVTSDGHAHPVGTVLDPATDAPLPRPVAKAPRP